MKEWQKIYETEHPVRAEIVKSVLEDSGISAIIMDKKDRNYQFGTLEILVKRAEVVKSIRIIQDEIKFN